MLIPIEKVSILLLQADNDLKFAASFVAQEIRHLCGFHPSIILSPHHPNFGYAILIEWYQLGHDGCGDSHLLSFNQTGVAIRASTKRGLLFAIGRFLRYCPIKSKRLEVPGELELASVPASRIRGYQIGYGKLSNSMDSWSVAQFDRHIRDLIIFGCNSIEIEYKPDSSPHHILPFHQMMTEICGLAARYNLDCTLWIPNLEAASYYLDPRFSQRELEQRRELFSSMPKLSAITVPGGDPGQLRPQILFPWIQRLTDLLRQCGHPAAAWVSAQWMRADCAWYQEFLQLANQKPAWLRGIVHGPWTQLSIPDLRHQLRSDLPLRRYPDLSHCIFCQYPVPDWDLAHAMTSGREPINPRPQAYKKIHNLYRAQAVGSIPHTTGINADINTFVWLDQEWDPNSQIRHTLADYARLFLHPSLASDFADGILALEKNWSGALVSNRLINTTLDRWKQLQKLAPSKVSHHWRFQAPLLRAYYDAYTQRRLIREQAITRQICDRANNYLSQESIAQDLSHWTETGGEADSTELRDQCIKLSEELYQSIGLKSSVKKHLAVHQGRGAFMDAIDAPLSDSRGLIHQLKKAQKQINNQAQPLPLGSMREPLGPGGIYDNLGTPDQIGRLINPVDIKSDPSGLAGSRSGFGVALAGMARSQTVEIKAYKGVPIPMAWLTCIESIYHTPLVLFYDGLDDLKTYQLYIVYPSRIGNRAKLIANKIYHS